MNASPLLLALLLASAAIATSAAAPISDDPVDPQFKAMVDPLISNINEINVGKLRNIHKSLAILIAGNFFASGSAEDRSIRAEEEYVRRALETHGIPIAEVGVDHDDEDLDDDETDEIPNDLGERVDKEDEGVKDFEEAAANSNRQEVPKSAKNARLKLVLIAIFLMLATVIMGTMVGYFTCGVCKRWGCCKKEADEDTDVEVVEIIDTVDADVVKDSLVKSVEKNSPEKNVGVIAVSS